MGFTLVRVQEMTIIGEYLDQLWKEILSATAGSKIAAEKIAEFEALFMMTNFPGRSGAAIGDSLSLVLQMNKKMKLRTQFDPVDHVVLTSSSIDDYIRRRTPQLIP